jgi:hypothetical protein
MKRYLPIFFIFLISCSYGANNEPGSESLNLVAESTDVITETSFKYIDSTEAVVVENITDKKTIILFWADY